jgi:hypothetical protein
MELKSKYADLCAMLNLAVADFEIAMGADFSKYDALEIDWIKNAQIQKFEFSIELLWKTAKIYLESVEEKIYSPKLCIKSLYLLTIIDEDSYLKLMDCLVSRNHLSHIYKFEMFDLIQKELPGHLAVIKQTALVLSNLEIL